MIDTVVSKLMASSIVMNNILTDFYMLIGTIMLNKINKLTVTMLKLLFDYEYKLNTNVVAAFTQHRSAHA